MEEARRFNVRGVYARFLRQNPRFINAPICNINHSIDSNATTLDCMNWLPQAVDHGERGSHNMTRCIIDIKPAHALPLTLVHHHKAPKTTIQELLKPESQSKQCMLTKKEFISYKHQYDCRKSPNEPIRGKLQGSFVYGRNET